MATPMDYLSASDFAADALTEAINIAPYQTGRPAQLGIFTDTPINTTYVRLGVQERDLILIPSKERGGESNLNMRPERKGVVDFQIPHFPLDDTIRPSDIQNLVAWDSEYVMESLTGVYMQRLDDIREKHHQTHSHLEWGALNGIVIDATGKELVNIYEEFDIEPTEVLFNLEAAATDIAELNRTAKAIIRKELRGTPVTGMRALAGKEFFDRYVSHPFVKEQLAQYSGQTPNPNRDDVEDIFTFAGLTLERIDEEFHYRQPDGTLITREAVAEDEAILVPLGSQYFKRYVAPPDTLAGANKKPKVEEKIFISTRELAHDKGMDIHSESNVLPLCQRPNLMVRLKIGAAQ